MADQVKNAEPGVLRASRRNVKRALASTKSAGIRAIEDQITTLWPCNARYTGDHRSIFRKRYAEMITRVSLDLSFGDFVCALPLVLVHAPHSGTWLGLVGSPGRRGWEQAENALGWLQGASSRGRPHRSSCRPVRSPCRAGFSADYGGSRLAEPLPVTLACRDPGLRVLRSRAEDRRPAARQSAIPVYPYLGAAVTTL